MGCHIDGFIAVVAHTHVLHQGPVTGRAADVIAAANTAAEVALRLVRPGKKVYSALPFGLLVVSIIFVSCILCIVHGVVTDAFVVTNLFQIVY